jgi:hypothetical protein
MALDGALMTPLRSSMRRTLVAVAAGLLIVSVGHWMLLLLVNPPQGWDSDGAIVVTSITVPLLAAAVWTAAQQRRGVEVASFDQDLLIASAAVGLFAVALLWGDWPGVVVSLLIVAPLAAVLLLVSWVQPRGAATVATVLLGLVQLVPAWCLVIGAIDRRLDTAVAGAILIGILGIPIWHIRRYYSNCARQPGRWPPPTTPAQP